MTATVDITFAPLGRADLGQIAHWLAQPHVERWWAHESTSEAVERDFGPMIDGDEQAEGWVVLEGGRAIGFLQYYRFGDEPEYTAEMAPIYPVGPEMASIDYFIGDATRIGQGVGSKMIDLFVQRAFSAAPQMPAIVVPTHADNVASGRALVKAGFREVARGEMEPDNPSDSRDHIVWRRDRG